MVESKKGKREMSKFYHALLTQRTVMLYLWRYLSHLPLFACLWFSGFVFADSSAINQAPIKTIITPRIIDKGSINHGVAAMDLISYYQEISASVYFITVKNQELPNNSSGSGSAVAVTKNQLLTNCHIFGKKLDLDGNTIRVVKKGSPVMNGRLVQRHSESDRCVLEVDGVLSPVKALRAINSLSVGERVYAIGNPKGFIDAFAEGLISAVRPSKKTGIVLLTTTGIAKGSSGGALFDSGGNLIGITTAVISDAPHLALVIPAESFFLEDLPFSQ
jgi:S1-C subfamily serine protease